MTRLSAFLFALMLLLTGCGGEDAPATGNGQGGGNRANTSTAAPENASLQIAQPAADATVGPNPVLRLKADGLKLGKKGNALLVAYVDREPTAGEAAPAKDPNIQRSNRQRVRLRNLSPGEHTVTVVATNRRGVPLQPPVQASITFTVDPAAAKNRPASPAPAESPAS